MIPIIFDPDPDPDFDFDKGGVFKRQSVLRYDPYQVFEGSKTPAGLYARQNWMGQSGSRGWKADVDDAVDRIVAGQAEDGSWNGSVTVTVARLFALHLTVREADDRIDRALDWLLKPLHDRLADVPPGLDPPAPAVPIDGLPFSEDRTERLRPAAALFLACVFGRARTAGICRLYDALLARRWRAELITGAPAHAGNLLRALVVHPVYRDHEQVLPAGDILRALQTAEGDWGRSLPFHQTANALAHTSWPSAQEPLEKAFRRLRATQNPDGSWSRCQKEWNTFLAVHALRNKGRL